MIPMPAGTQIWVACGTTDMRKGFDGLAMLVQDVLKKAAHSGHLFVFRGKRAQLSTFYIRFSFRDDHLSLASTVRTNAPGVAIPARQGFDLHLHR
jgi:transposase